jgi:hypothetical protein
MAPVNKEASLLPSRTKFTRDEDEQLRELVAHLGAANWSAVSAKMQGRTARQCRERYKYFLHPSLQNGPWTGEEEEMLRNLYSRFGPNWVALKKYFPTRSNNNIKNHWAVMSHEKIGYPSGPMAFGFYYTTPPVIVAPMVTNRCPWISEHSGPVTRESLADPYSIQGLLSA